MRLALLNFYDANYAEVGALSAPTKVAYCARQGYAYISERQPTPDRPASWHKLAMLRRYLPYFDWLMWNDADTLWLNYDRGLEPLLDPAYPIITGSDSGGINCGNMLIQCGAYTATLLEEWWQQTEWLEHPLWEQKALTEMVRRDIMWQRRVKVLPQNEINSYEITYQPGDRLIHFAGYGRDRAVLLAKMRQWRDRSQADTSIGVGYGN